MNVVEQGETFTFDFSLSGNAVEDMSANMSVLQYPGDTPTISRSLTYDDGKFVGTLTSAETATLDIGQWFIHLRATDSDENIREIIKIYITKGWV